jgi:hypothetical protein
MKTRQTAIGSNVSTPGSISPDPDDADRIAHD